MTEADFLAALRALAAPPGRVALADDAARLGELGVTTDTIVEGVHYLADDPPGDVAWKLLAVNLSDLAAKGATPEGVLLNYPLRADVPATPTPSPAKAGAQVGDGDGEGQRFVTTAFPTGPRPSPGREGEGKEGGWDAAFLAGLATALTHFACPLLGGDTVSLPPGAPRVLTLTAIGRAAAGPPQRRAARATRSMSPARSAMRAPACAIARGENGPGRTARRLSPPAAAARRGPRARAASSMR